MDSPQIALAVATVVVLILLMSCWDDKPQSRPRSCPKSRVVVLKGMDPDDDSHQRSDWGQGKKSRQLARQNNDLVRLSEYDDYSTVAKYQALEPEVFDSHEQYADQVGVANSGASNMTVRSDPNDVVPWVGLRRPEYHKTFAKSDARQVHSEYSDQMFSKTRYLL